ncbi:MAG: hypothetical protein WC584_02905 [Candidatus Pacearchaeota archaeon]
MVREDIAAGLKNAISKGESLRQAMMSFYKAGYIKEDIEDAARFIQNEQAQQRMSANYPENQEDKSVQNFPRYNPPSQEEQIQSKLIQRISQYGSQTVEQKVTNHTEEKNSKLGWIILIAGSLIIIASAILVIIFKSRITEFFKLAG